MGKGGEGREGPRDSCVGRGGGGGGGEWDRTGKRHAVGRRCRRGGRGGGAGRRRCAHGEEVVPHRQVLCVLQVEASHAVRDIPDIVRIPVMQILIPAGPACQPYSHIACHVPEDWIRRAWLEFGLRGGGGCRRDIRVSHVSVCASVRPSVRPSVRLSLCLSVALSVSVSVSVCLSVCLSLLSLSVCLSACVCVCVCVCVCLQCPCIRPSVFLGSGQRLESPPVGVILRKGTRQAKISQLLRPQLHQSIPQIDGRSMIPEGHRPRGALVR